MPKARKYRPSNGSEGEIFQGVFCDNCIHDAKYRESQDGEDGCKILAAALSHETRSPKYPAEWTYDASGLPTCTAFLREQPECPHGFDDGGATKREVLKAWGRA